MKRLCAICLLTMGLFACHGLSEFPDPPRPTSSDSDAKVPHDAGTPDTAPDFDTGSDASPDLGPPVAGPFNFGNGRVSPGLSRITGATVSVIPANEILAFALTDGESLELHTVDFIGVEQADTERLELDEPFALNNASIAMTPIEGAIDFVAIGNDCDQEFDRIGMTGIVDRFSESANFADLIWSECSAQPLGGAGFLGGVSTFRGEVDSPGIAAISDDGIIIESGPIDEWRHIDLITRPVSLITTHGPHVVARELSGDITFARLDESNQPQTTRLEAFADSLNTRRMDVVHLSASEYLSATHDDDGVDLSRIIVDDDAVDVSAVFSFDAFLPRFPRLAAYQGGIAVFYLEADRDNMGMFGNGQWVMHTCAPRASGWRCEEALRYDYSASLDVSAVDLVAVTLTNGVTVIAALVAWRDGEQSRHNLERVVLRSPLIATDR